MSEAKEKTPKTEKPAKEKVEKPAKEKVEKIAQNGITRPRAGTATGRVWEIADSLSNALGAPVKRAEVLKAAEAEGINAATVATQYGKWRKFHGIVAEPKAEPVAADPAAANSQM